MATKPAITPFHVVIATLQTGVPFTQHVMVTAVRMDLSNHVIRNAVALDAAAQEEAQEGEAAQNTILGKVDA